MNKLLTYASTVNIVNSFSDTKMAPALVEQVTEHAAVGYKSGVGQYKELGYGGPKTFSKDLELRGTEKHAAARYPHYLPTWDNEKGNK